MDDAVTEGTVRYQYDYGHNNDKAQDLQRPDAHQRHR
jgi:hypothetical protein